jgi:hypothetical protein
LLVVFDETNRVAVFDRYPALTVPVVRLDELGTPGEIADPVDGGLEEFQRCYQRITAGVAELVELLNASHQNPTHVRARGSRPQRAESDAES